MKKITVFIFLVQITTAKAQVIIGNAIGTASNKNSVLLEFADNNNKGLILPYVKTLPATATQGTLVLDSTDPTSAIMKYYDGNTWRLLSDGADISSALLSQPDTAEHGNAKVIIGDPATTADGVLVLESDTKALVLPQVTDVQNILSPSPGMIVYVKGAEKYLAVYNGSKWAFWKP